MRVTKTVKDYEALSATAQIDSEGLAILSFLNRGPENLVVSMHRSVVEQLGLQIAEALAASPVPSVRRSKEPE